MDAHDNQGQHVILTYYTKLYQDAKYDHLARATSPHHRTRVDPISIYSHTKIAPPRDLMSLSDSSSSVYVQYFFLYTFVTTTHAWDKEYRNRQKKISFMLGHDRKK